MLDERNFSKYLSNHEIEVLVQSLAERINKDYKGKNLLLVAVLKGTIIFAADLIRKLEMDPEIEFVRMTSYGKKSRASSGTVAFLKDIQSDLRGKHVLIVEEIIDSGRSLEFLYERLKKAEPESVEVCTLLDKSKKRVVTDVPVKYVGRVVDDPFLVGYGLDLEEKFRNLKDIHYLKYPN